MKYYFCLILLFFTCTIFSQETTIIGKITDEAGIPLEFATVHLEKIKDSSLVSYTVSGEDGVFELKGRINDENGNLFISFSGFTPYQNTIKLEEEVNLGTIIMEVQQNTLDEVLITTTTPPMTIKKDTTEFNAGSFKTPPNANLEEVMKKLPGVEIDSEGNITMNGKPISRIIVNGEEFFGDDPQIALKNLPKEIINKIQFTDTKTESEEFTGESGDSDNLTVNITIKEDQNKGYFARATVGGGTNERYEMSGIFNYFEDEFRTSVLGSSNNINSSGFSHDETFGMMGRRAARGDGGSGITKSESAGINATNEWKDKWGLEEVEASGDYFFGKNDTERRSASFTEYLLPDSRYFKNSAQASNHINDSHRATTEFEVEFDTLTRISMQPRISANFGKSLGEGITESVNEAGNLINSTETSQNRTMSDLNFSNEIDFIKRFGGNGSFLGIELSTEQGSQKNENFYYSETTFLREGDQVIEIQDQFIDEDESEEEYSLEVRQRRMLFENFFLDASYNFDYSHSSNQRYVYETEGEDSTYTSINNLLSNDFDLISRRHVPNLGVNYDTDTWEFETEIGILHTQIENNNYLEETAFQNEYSNLFLNADIEYEKEGRGSLSIDYETEADIPSIRELQPVVDRTDPLDMVVGNPELKPTYNHEIDLRYQKFNYDTRSGVSTWLGVDLVQNNVVSVTTIDEDLVRFTRFTNIDGAVDANAGVSYNKQVKGENREFRYRVRVSGSYDKNIGFTNAVKFQSQQYSLSPNIRVTYSIDDILEINPDYKLTYSTSTYDINVDRKEDYMNHELGLEFTTYWPEDLLFANNISYRYLENVAPGFSNSSILWNLSLGYQFLGDDAALRIKIYDLLDQNVETRRTIADDYIRDSSNLILKRYAMFSLTYKISNFGGKSPES